MRNQKGQVALIVLLATAVALTLGLTTSRKVVTETKIDTDEEMLKEAFNTAESGIDYFLGTGKTDYVTPEGLRAEVMVDNISKTGRMVEFDEVTLTEQRVNFWLVEHDTDGDLVFDGSNNYGEESFDVCVENAFSGTLLVDYFYQEGGAGGPVKIKRSGYNFGDAPNAIAVYGAKLNPGNDSCGTGKKAAAANYSTPNMPGNRPLLISAMPLFAASRVALRLQTAATIFPIQGREISSRSIVGDEELGVRRTIKILNRYEVPSFLFDALTSSGGSIRSN